MLKLERPVDLTDGVELKKRKLAITPPYNISQLTSSDGGRIGLGLVGVAILSDSFLFKFVFVFISFVVLAVSRKDCLLSNCIPLLLSPTSTSIRPRLSF